MKTVWLGSLEHHGLFLDHTEQIRFHSKYNGNHRKTLFRYVI